MDLKISRGENEAQLKADVIELLKEGWKLDEECIQLEKTYNFKTYTKVADFHLVISVKCKSRNHHPTMITTSRTLTVQWTTHIPRGISNKDTSMAKYCDEEAKSIGTVEQDKIKPSGPAASAL